MSVLTDRLRGVDSGLAVKAPCVVATSSNVTLSGLQTIGGVTLASGDRVLVKSQTSSIDNGIYNASSGLWTRAGDFDGATDVVGGTMCTVADDGDITIYVVGGTGAIVPGEDAITFSSLSVSLTPSSVATDAIWDAAGDLAVGTGANTAAKLTIGASGKVLTSNGTTATWATPADMDLASAQSVAGLKTFDPSKMAMKGSSTGKTTFATANASATNYTITFQAATGTVALTSDLTTGYQPLDADLTTIAGLTATTDNFIQSKSSAWSSRTVAQVAADLNGTGLVSTSLQLRARAVNSKSAAYTTVAADAGNIILHPSADTTARTFTIDSNANVAYPVGTMLTFINQASAGSLTISVTADTMRLAGAGTTGNRTLAANGIARAHKVTTTEWLIEGTGLT